MRALAAVAFASALAVAPTSASAGDCTQAGGWDCPAIPIALEPLMAGEQAVSVNVPTAILFSPLTDGGPEHVIVADKDGAVTAWDSSSGASKTLLQLRGVASMNPERGLLGLALHPEFLTDPQKRRFYTYHTTPRTAEANAECDRMPPFNTKNLPEICAKGEQYGCGGSLHVTEWAVTDIDGGNPSTSLVKRELLERKQPGEGHNAGHVRFGPDGMLYVSLGDGGAQMDPCSRGQDTSQPYSAILRMDPTGDDLVPADNPFVGMDGHEPLIWAYGFRNPWRLEFTPAGIDGVPADVLLVADTGQARYEEIDVVVRGGNYGWSAREGTLNHPKKGEAPASEDFVAPLFQYGNPKGKSSSSGGLAVVGGVVATGDAVPALRGMYLFGDNVTQKLWALDLAASNLTDRARWTGVAKVHDLKGGKVPPATFGRDSAGDVVVGGSGGKIFRVVAGQ